MFRGEGDSDEACPEDAALLSDGCRAARGSNRSMALGGDCGSDGDGIEQGDVAKDGGSAWMVMAGKKVHEESASPFSVDKLVNGSSKLSSEPIQSIREHFSSTKFTTDNFPSSFSKGGETTSAAM